MAKKKAPKAHDWKDFEKAVAAFVQLLDPTAEVTYDAKIPDKDTGDKRQRDVLIRSLHLGHFPTLIVVSCKRERHKLDIKDVTDFVGEIDSCNANVGVIYSYSGFTKPAIRKAKARNISCCRLYRNQPADMPESLIIGKQYMCQPRLGVAVGSAYADWRISCWNDVFRIKVGDPGAQTDLIYLMAEQFQSGLEKSLAARGAWLPPDWQDRITISAAGKPDLNVKVSGTWITFEAKLKAIKLNGSYSITNRNFIGEQFGPIIDMHSAQPGPGWTALSERPEIPKGNYSIVYRGGTNPKHFEEQLVPQMGSERIGI